MRKGIIGFILGILLSGTIISAAVSISSDKISYNNTTVKDSLDNLFNESVSGKNYIINALSNKGFNVQGNSTYTDIVNGINELPVTIGKDSDGNYGYFNDDNEDFTPFNGGKNFFVHWGYTSSTGYWTLTKLSDNNYSFQLNNWTGYYPYFWIAILDDFSNYDTLSFYLRTSAGTSDLFYITSASSYGSVLIDSGESGGSSLLPSHGTKVGTITTTDTKFTVDISSINTKTYIILELYCISTIGTFYMHDIALS